MITKATPKDAYVSEILNIANVYITDDCTETAIFKRNYDLTSIDTLFGVLEFHRTGSTNDGTLRLYVNSVKVLEAIATDTPHARDEAFIDVSTLTGKKEIKLTIINDSGADSVIDIAYLNVIDS